MDTVFDTPLCSLLFSLLVRPFSNLDSFHMICVKMRVFLNVSLSVCGFRRAE